jgi:hypothetical protein
MFSALIDTDDAVALIFGDVVNPDISLTQSIRTTLILE